MPELTRVNRLELNDKEAQLMVSFASIGMAVVLNKPLEPGHLPATRFLVVADKDCAKTLLEKLRILNEASAEEDWK
jgi:hypothetical protein